jgi:hypothetical protein
MDNWQERQERRVMRARAWYNAAINGVVAKRDALEALTIIEDQVVRDQLSPKTPSKAPDSPQERT